MKLSYMGLINKLSISSLFFVLVGCITSPKIENTNAHFQYLPSVIEMNKFILDVVKLDTLLTTKDIEIFPILNSKELYNSNIDFITDNDKSFMKLQDTLFDGVMLLPCFFENYKLVKLDSSCYKVNNTDFVPYKNFSTPLFTENRKYAIVEIGYHLGFLVSEGYCVLFKKENGIWKEISRKLLWTS